MRTATILLALVASANAAPVILSPGASYNLDYTTDASTTVSTDLSGHITTIKSQLAGGDFAGAYTTYDTNVKPIVDAVTSSATLTLFNAHNADAGATFSAQVTQYLSDVKVRRMNKP